MNKLLKGLAAIVIGISLVGCGTQKKVEKIELSGRTYTLQLPVSDDKLLNVEMPEEYGVSLCENFSYWQLSDNTTISISPILNHLPNTKTDVSGLYENDESISYDYMDKTVTIRCSEEKHDVFRQSIINSKVVNTDTSAPKIIQLDKYPKHNRVQMKLYDSNMYMPEGAQETKLGIYTASLHTNGRDFLMSWICDGKRDEVQKKIINICIANSGNKTLSQWYGDDELFFAQTGTNVVGMKKLRVNEWYVYSGTTPYRDYVLTGLRTVHGGDSK